MLSRETIPDWDRKTVREVGYVEGAAFMLPRSIVAHIGLLDEQLPMYFEDLEISARLGAAGKPLFYLPSALITHLGAQSADLSPARLLLFAMENGQAPWMYFRKFQGYWPAKIFTLITFLGSFFRLLLLALLVPIIALKGKQAVLVLHQHLKKSRALLWWSLCDQYRFNDHVTDLFALDAQRIDLEADRRTLYAEIGSASTHPSKITVTGAEV